MYFFYYFPVGLDLKVKRTPVITLFLAITCVTTFLIYRYGPFSLSYNLNNLVFQPSMPLPTTALAHVFLHAGWMHLAGNLVYLVLFGRVLEDRLGPGRFFILFALSAMAGAYTHTFMTTLIAPEFIGYGVIGASGATSGLLGAYVVRFYFSRISVAYWIFMPLQGVNRAGRKYVPGILAVAFWLLYQGVYTMMQFGAGYMHVAYSVHLGGFACGALMAMAFGGGLEARAERRLIKAREHASKASYFASQGEYINYLDLKPDDGSAHAEAARVFCSTGEKGRAKYHFTEAITGMLGDSLVGEAEDTFTSAMRCLPGFALAERVHLRLAFGMERSLKFNGAMQAYSNFLGRYPVSGEKPLVLLRMAGLHERRFGRPDEAYGCLNSLVEDFPDDSWADFARAELERLKLSRLVIGSVEAGRQRQA